MEINASGLVRDSDLGTDAAHRVMPYQDVWQSLLPMYDALVDGRMLKMKHKKYGQTALGYVCQNEDCNHIHGAIDITIYDRKPFKPGEDRYFLTSMDLPPFTAFMAANKQETLAQPKLNPEVEAAVSRIRSVREAQSDDTFTDENIVDAIVHGLNLLGQGGMYMGLDLETGFTALLGHCKDCEALHPIMGIKVAACLGENALEDYKVLKHSFHEHIRTETTSTLQ